jgi:Predicted membrane protein
LSKNGVLRESRKRHLAKTFTWRGLGTLDTMIISWIITGNPFTGLKIGLAELITKMILYYIHERVWYRMDYGLKKDMPIK